MVLTQVGEAQWDASMVPSGGCVLRGAGGDAPALPMRLLSAEVAEGGEAGDFGEGVEHIWVFWEEAKQAEAPRPVVVKASADDDLWGLFGDEDEVIQSI